MIAPDIIEFITDLQLLNLSLSPAQEALLRTIYGLELNEEQKDIRWRCTKRTEFPADGFGEASVICGARSGKDSRIAAPLVCYEALFGGHDKAAGKGEVPTIPLVAMDARGGQIAYGFIRQYLEGSSLLASMVDEVFASEIRLVNGVVISVFPCTLKALRGWAIPAACLDELALWGASGGGENLDAEVMASIRRGTVGFRKTRICKITTAYLHSGIAYEDWKRSFAQPDPDLLVWNAPSLLMNPSLDPEKLERERRLDPSRFAREYEAIWQDNLSAHLPPEWVDAAVQVGRRELPPRDGVAYVAGYDGSGGVHDASVLSIAHVEGAEGDCRVVQDVLKGWNPRSSGHLEGVIADATAILKRYDLDRVFGDKYASQWVVQAFQRHGIKYLDPGLDRSQAFVEAEPLFATGRIDLLDHPVQTREFKALARTMRPGGKVHVTHPRGGTDDHGNACALAATKALELSAKKRRPRIAPPIGVGNRRPGVYHGQVFGTFTVPSFESEEAA